MEQRPDDAPMEVETTIRRNPRGPHRPSQGLYQAYESRDLKYAGQRQRLFAAEKELNKYLQRTVMIAPRQRGSRRAATLMDLANDRHRVMYHNPSQITKHDSRAFNPNWKGYDQYWGLHDLTTRMLRTIRRNKFEWMPYHAEVARSTVYEANRWGRQRFGYIEAQQRLGQFFRMFKDQAWESFIRPLTRGVGSVMQPNNRRPPALKEMQRQTKLFMDNMTANTIQRALRAARPRR